MKTFVLPILCFFSIGVSSPNAHAQTKHERQVLRFDGTPAANVAVRAWLGADANIYGPYNENDNALDQPAREVVTRTDANGKYRIETRNQREEHALIVVDAPEHALQFADFGIRSKRPLQLVKNTPIEGEVKDANGHAVAEALVCVSAVGGNTYVPVSVQDPRRLRVPQLIARSGADGRFQLRGANFYGLKDASQLWAVTRTGARTQMGTTGRRYDAKEPISIVVQPTFSLHGQVVDDATGKPLAGARVRYSNSLLPEPPRFTDARGRFRFDDSPRNLTPVLHATHPNFPKAWMQIMPTRALTESLAPPLVVRLRPVVKVSGRVVDELSGNALPMRVTIYANWSQPVGEWTQHMTGSASTFVGKNAFEMWAPLGSSVLTTDDWNGEGALETQRVPLEVSAQGVQNLLVKVRPRPGLLLRFEPKPGAVRKSFSIYKRTPEGEKHLGSDEWLWFHATTKWGETMEIRGVGAGKKEVFGWTKVTASLEQWPTIIALP